MLQPDLVLQHALDHQAGLRASGQQAPRRMHRRASSRRRLGRAIMRLGHVVAGRHRPLVARSA